MDSKVALPAAAGVATCLTLLLVGVIGDVQWHAPVTLAPLITRVDLIVHQPTPRAPAAPPRAVKAVTPVVDRPKAKLAKAPNIVSPVAEVKLPPPVVAPLVNPAAVLPLATAPVMATAPVATAGTVSPAPPSALPVAVHQVSNSTPSIAVVCPVQVRPEMPRKAIQEGLSGRVRARALIQDGLVKEVVILSGPQVFHASVKAAMLKYQCESRSAPVTAEQVVDFEVE